MLVRQLRQSTVILLTSGSLLLLTLGERLASEHDTFPVGMRRVIEQLSKRPTPHRYDLMIASDGTIKG
jgi:hypothetical protein